MPQNNFFIHETKNKHKISNSCDLFNVWTLTLLYIEHKNQKQLLILIMMEHQFILHKN